MSKVEFKLQSRELMFFQHLIFYHVFGVNRNGIIILWMQFELFFYFKTNIKNVIIRLCVKEQQIGSTATSDVPFEKVPRILGRCPFLVALQNKSRCGRGCSPT